MSEAADIPLNWERLKLGSICVLSTEKASPAEFQNIPYIGLEHIERDTHRIIGLGDASTITSVKSHFNEGDLLYGRLRPNLNKVAIAPFDGVCSTAIFVFRPTSKLLTRYLLEILSTREFQSYASSQAKGVNLPRISISSLMAYEADIPPLSEQARIVENLETQFSHLRNIEDSVNSATHMLQMLPRKILAAAARGRLTRDWRSKRPLLDDHQLGSQLDSCADEPGALPASWKSICISDAGEVRTGRQRSPDNHQGTNLRSYLRVANVLEDRIDISDVMEMNFTPREFEIFKLVSGDILLNEGQSLELVGRAAMFRGELEDVCFTNSLIRFRSSKDVVPEFALIVFRHYLHAGVFQKVAKRTTNLAHLGTSRFASLPFPLPAYSEQEVIASETRSYLDQTERLRNQLDRIKMILAACRAAVRLKALRGQLIEADLTALPVSIAAEDVVASPVPVRKAAMRLRSQGVTTMQRISAIKAAQTAGKALSGQQLFAASGYPDDASTEMIEQFYLDLREALRDRSLLVREEGGVDLFYAATKSSQK